MAGALPPALSSLRRHVGVRAFYVLLTPLYDFLSVVFCTGYPYSCTPTPGPYRALRALFAVRSTETTR